MEHEEFFIHKLEHRHIKPTATRLLILQQMYRGDEMVSLPELERLLPTVDKSTISRSLTLFLLNFCERCRRTFCLKQIHVPVVPLPDGFKLNSINYVLKGLCPECSEE